MTAELTNEQIVTHLLSSNEVLKPLNDSVFISNPDEDTLGEYLAEIPIEVVIQDNSKYVFIK